MKLPFRSTDKQAARTNSSRSESVPSSKSVSLRVQLLVLIAAGVLLLGIPPATVYLQTALTLKNAEQKQAQLAAALFAGGIRQWVERQSATAELAVRDPQLAGVLSDGDARARDQQAASLAYLFPEAIRVRLLSPGIEDVDLQANPPISYAALDMLKQAETRDTPPPVEVHMSGTPQQHISLVQRILDPASHRVVGALMVSYPTRKLHDLLAHDRVAGYVEVQQVAAGTQLVIDRQGDEHFKLASADSTAPVAGSRWQVAYWAADRAGAGGSALLATATGATAVAAVLLAVLLWLVFRKLGAALQRDQGTLLTIAKDMRDGRGKGAYPAALTEMRDTIELMARAASAGVSRPAAAAEPVAPQEPSGRDVVDELDGDLLFDANALDISRVGITETRVDPNIFRAYDIRGIVDENLTEDVAFDIGRAIGSEAYFRGEQTIVVGHDGRLSGSEMSAALVRGLLATGRDVKDVGQVPTPVLYFAAQYLGSNSGVMVTGSHNPANYNGFKVVLAGETLANEAIDALRQRIESGDMLTGEGSAESVDVLPDYIERVKSDVQIARPMKVVVDCGNGVAGVVIPQLLRALGCEVVELHCDVDGRFPNHHPDPSKPENLADLIQAVQANGAELGIAFDGDADRLGVISSQGEVIWPDRVLMLLAVDVLSRNPGALIIYDVKSSRHVASLVAEHGGEPLMWATGHSLIKAKMKETGALLAGEMSGHIFFKERWFGFDDALYSAARLLEILANDARSSSELFAQLPESMSTPEINIPMAEGEPAAFMEKLLNSAHFDNARVATIDGMRVEFDRGWGLVRASNTTPSLVLRFEADDELALSTIQDEFRRVMLQADPGMTLPF